MVELLELLEPLVRLDRQALRDRRATLGQPVSQAPRVHRVLLATLGLPDQSGHRVSRVNRDHRVLLEAPVLPESREIPDTLEQRDPRDSWEIRVNRV